MIVQRFNKEQTVRESLVMVLNSRTKHLYRFFFFANRQYSDQLCGVKKRRENLISNTVTSSTSILLKITILNEQDKLPGICLELFLVLL